MIIKKDKDMILNYFEDNSGMTGAFADYVAIAQNEDEIADFLIEAEKNKTPVTVVGALTGNTGSALAYGGAVLSLENFNQIREIKIINNEEAEITVGAAARLGDIKQKVFESGWLYPPDPTEKNATIGGNIATNASGGRGFKFGVTRDYIKAIKVIFTDGSKSYIERGKYKADDFGKIIFDTSKGKREIVLPKYTLPKIKNAAGYYNYPNADLIDVFIGSDGTLAITLEAKLKLIRHFKEVFGGIVFFKEQNSAYDFVKKVKEISKQAKGKDEISAMSLEYFDKNALNLIRDDYPLIPKDACAGILFEQDIYDLSKFDLLLDKWIDFINLQNIDTKDVWFASNITQQEEFRKFRHKIPQKVNEMVRKNKIPKVGTDFAVPEGKLPEMVDYCKKEFDKSGLFNLTFGHIGENHLHANIIATNKEEYNRTKEMYARIAQKAVDLGGTVSAEHGIGKVKHIFLEKMLGKEGFKQMANFKKSIDKSTILGIDNIFPKEYLSD